MDIGPQSPSDSKFTAKCRFHQSKYRADILKEPFGFGPHEKSKNPYGNMLIDGISTGSNFISQSAFLFAKQKVLDKQINKFLTIDEYRLFNNMLSSMPMCFNLFADLRNLLLLDNNEVSRICKLLFQEIDWIENAKYIDVEFIPTPIVDYTNDKSAFDAMIIVEDKKGDKGLISIETKYTDLLGSNSSSDSDIKNSIINKEKMFDSELSGLLANKGYQQIHRNYILTYIYAKKNNFKHFANIVLSPKEDSVSQKEIDEMKSHMLKDWDSILKISLEDFVDRGMKCGNENIGLLMKKFYQRYLDFDNSNH